MTDMPTPNTPLSEAIDYVNERIEAGVVCPCCGQFTKVYRRKITGPMADVLIKMYRRSDHDWIYLPDIRSRGQDEAIMRYWGLIESRPGMRDDGSRRTGWWRLTPTGVSFVHNNFRVPKYAWIYDNQALRLDGAEISITDALGTRFNYDELMMGL